MTVWTTLALVNALDICERGLDARDTLAAKLGVGPNDRVDMLTILDELGLSDALFCMGAPGKACKAQAESVLGTMMLEILAAVKEHRLVITTHPRFNEDIRNAARCIDLRGRGHRRDALADVLRARLAAIMSDTEAPDVRCWIELHWTLLDPTVTLSTALVRAVACLNDLAALHGRQRRVLYDLTGRLRAHLTETA